MDPYMDLYMDLCLTEGPTGGAGEVKGKKKQKLAKGAQNKKEASNPNSNTNPNPNPSPNLDPNKKETPVGIPKKKSENSGKADKSRPDTKGGRKGAAAEGVRKRSKSMTEQLQEVSRAKSAQYQEKADAIKVKTFAEIMAEKRRVKGEP